MKRTWITRILAALLLLALALGGTAALAAPLGAAQQTDLVSILFQIPEGGGTVSLDNGDRAWEIPHDGSHAVLAAPPGDYTLRCGECSASIRLGQEVAVLGGEAAWDGEILTMGRLGSLELQCSVLPGQEKTITIRSAGGTDTRTAAYDPALGGQPVIHRLSLPAGAVSVSCGEQVWNVTLRVGETSVLRVE